MRRKSEAEGKVGSGEGGLQDPGGWPLGNGGSKPRPGEGGKVERSAQAFPPSIKSRPDVRCLIRLDAACQQREEENSFFISRASNVTLPPPPQRNEARLELRPGTKTLKRQNRRHASTQKKHAHRTAQAFLHCGVFFSLLASVNSYMNRLHPEASTDLALHPRHAVGPRPDAKPNREDLLVRSQHPPNKLGPIPPPCTRPCGEPPDGGGSPGTRHQKDVQLPLDPRTQHCGWRTSRAQGPREEAEHRHLVPAAGFDDAV